MSFCIGRTRMSLLKAFVRVNLSTSSRLINSDIADNQAKLFFRTDVQKILHQITGFDLQKVFQKRPTKNHKAPTYKLMTDAQLHEAEEDTLRKARERLQMPPFLKVHEGHEDILSNDPQISGYLTHPIVFTDITYNVPHKKRAIVVRQPDGRLHQANNSTRTRMLQIYFPTQGKYYRMPEMFKEENLEKLFAKEKYEYILDRACIQFEPDEPDYLRVTHRTYEHIASASNFHLLRSTRHFGTMAFYFVYYKKIDVLLADMINRDLLNDAASFIHLYHVVHPDCRSVSLVSENMSPVDLIQIFIDNDSAERGIVELALQSYLDSSKQETSSATR